MMSVYFVGLVYMSLLLLHSWLGFCESYVSEWVLRFVVEVVLL